MSFMEGFGSAFSRSFENDRARRTKQKDDIFKMTYDDFLKKKDTREKAKLDDTRAINKAKTFIEANGQPEEAWSQVYQWIKSGQDDGWIQQRLEKGKFTVIQKGSEKVVSEEPITPVFDEPSPTPADTQTAQVMQQNQALASQQSQPQGQRGSFFSRGREQREERYMNDAISKIGEVTGAGPDEVRRTLTEEYQPPVIDTASVQYTPATNDDNLTKSAKDAYVRGKDAERRGDKASATRFMQQYQDHLDVMGAEERIKFEAENPTISGQPVKILGGDGKIKVTSILKQKDGSIIDMDTMEPINPENVLPKTEHELDREDELRKNFKTPVQEMQQKKANLAGMYHSAGVLSSLAQANPKILTNMSRGISSWIQSTSQDVANTYNLFSSTINQSLEENKSGKSFTSEKLQELEAQADTILDKLGPDVNNTANAAALAAIHVNLMAYRLGVVLGQTGRGLAEVERKMFQDMINGRVDPTRYDIELGSLLKAIEVPLDQEGQNLFGSNNPEIESFVNDFRYNPFEKYHKPFSEGLPSELKPVYDHFSKVENEARILGSDGSTPKKPTVEASPQIIQPPATDDPAELQKWFDTIKPGETFVDPGDGQTYIKE